MELRFRYSITLMLQRHLNQTITFLYSLYLSVWIKLKAYTFYLVRYLFAHLDHVVSDIFF